MKPYLRKAQYHETDQMGIIHHANYVRWMEEARIEYMEQIGYGYDAAVKAGIDFAVTGVTCEYKSMVRFSDTVLIDVSMSLLTQTRMTVRYTIVDAETGDLRFTGESRHCYFSNEKKRPVSLKKALPDLYALFEKQMSKDQ
ncbi:acyl-CoA thioesterase [Christensenellaceae bacterium OttesenSCG-928-M15]|nr:acyl-CoA thioesterase [Christensenellaceae bacterium OttesenSCG-928-M15]